MPKATPPPASDDGGLSESDYDVISEAQSLESSIDDLGRYNALGVEAGGKVHEPPVSAVAKAKYATANLSEEDVQAYVRRALGRDKIGGGGGGGSRSATVRGVKGEVWEARTVRVYVDGLFDGFHVGSVARRT